MAKPKNEKTLRDITDAAWSSFVSDGFRSTSYESISRKSGVSKTLIQHYFPKKEDLVIAGISKLREASRIQAEKVIGEDSDSFRQFYVLGQIYLMALLSTEDTRSFLTEVLESRYLTSVVMDFDYDWSLAELGSSKEYEERKDYFRERTLEKMGGFYEILYRRLRENASVNVPESMQRVMEGMMDDFGIDKRQAKEYLEAWTLDEDVLEEAGSDALLASLQ